MPFARRTPRWPATLLVMLVMVLAGLGQPVTGLADHVTGPLVSTTSGPEQVCVSHGDDPLPHHCCGYEGDATRPETTPTTTAQAVTTGVPLAAGGDSHLVIPRSNDVAATPRSQLQVWRC